MKSHTTVSIDDEFKKEAIQDKINLSRLLNNELKKMYSNRVEIKKQLRELLSDALKMGHSTDHRLQELTERQFLHKHDILIEEL